NRFVQAVIKVQDANSGLWYDVVDKQSTPKNYKEASASCMLVYTLRKLFAKDIFLLPVCQMPKKDMQEY
ncbi:MAG: hypothetical protein HC867_06830, partial [Bacteroidia bacterium]|nr:hypothetical protein [Bacteroidia bacterium]